MYKRQVRKERSALIDLTVVTDAPIMMRSISLKLKAMVTLFLLCALTSNSVFASKSNHHSKPQNELRAAQIGDESLKAFLKDNIENDVEVLDIYEAEVWLETMLSQMAIYAVDKTEALAILHATHREASRANIPPDLVLAVIAIESSFDRFAVSSAGALGLMQVMPFWKDEIGRDKDNLLEIDTNIRYGLSLIHI